MRLDQYLEKRGSPGRLAAAIGVSASLVVQWARGKPVAVERCAAIERVTDGRVKCEEIRPDVFWHRVPDPAWPWHPEGRPMQDHTRQADTAAQAAGPSTAGEVSHAA